ncbi:MAG: DsrE family protein [Prevotellaceae bacterium]|nr:DsrE family protein [Prevotellaceae bacterium]
MSDKLNILWTTGDRITSLNMLSIYVLNSKLRGWWKDINVIIWGASAKLVASDTQVQTEVMEMIRSGVHIEACKDCSDVCGVSDELEKLGVEVKFMGESLTRYIKSEYIITI